MEDTYYDAAENICRKIESVQKKFVQEEDVRVVCERIFAEELGKIGINYDASYEVQVSSGAVDALYNELCIEYKKPGLLKRNFSNYAEEKSKYLPALAEKYHTAEDKIYGILLDGIQIGFFRRSAEGELCREGPFDISPNSIFRFLQIVNSTKRKPLTSDNLLKDLGPESKVTYDLVNVLWRALQSRSSIKTDMFYKEWSRVFGQVSNFGSDTAAVKKEAERYDLHILKGQAGEFIFILHTVYAIFIKHIALMILQEKRFHEYTTFRSVLNGNSLLDISRLLEDGTDYRNLGITNFLEGDFFCWYIEEWNADIEITIKSLITEILADYEPSTGTLKPEIVRDLLKGLYQGLMSKAMRHDLGEYYTPDWLAQYTINESRYQIGERVLDPSCGSGTFLVLLIHRTIEDMKKGYTAKDIVRFVTTHIYGIDLNPLAVLTARINYLLALEPYLDEIEFLEIPVYLSDAIFSPKREGDCYRYFIDTEDGRLQLKLPVSIFEKNILGIVLDEIEYCVRMSTPGRGNTITEEGAVKRIQQLSRYDLGEEELEQIIDLFKSIRNLELKNWDGIWCRIIKNYFTSAVLADFDVLVGNPPWLKWSALPTAYRTTIKDFCKNYGLFSSDKFYGGVESDVSTMVLYSAAEKWLRLNGRLAMLITRSVFKTESAEGFRRFCLPGNDHIKFEVEAVHDFTAIQPFSDAVNKPALLILKKGFNETEYPVPWYVWTKKQKNRIGEDEELHTVVDKTMRVQKAAVPVGLFASPWLTVLPSEVELCRKLARISGEKEYSARKGVCTDCNGVYFGNITGEKSSRITFRNNPSLGRKKIRQMEMDIERELLYPIARGREIKAFVWEFSGTYGILPQTTMHGFSVEEMLLKYPKALDYFSNFKEVLLERASLKRYLKNDPFYTCWNVGKYTFAPFKVCWAEISGQFRACILSEKDGQVVVPDHKIYFIPTWDEQEAKYLCAVLNAPAVEQFVLGYAETTQIGTHITDYIRIPHYNAADSVHNQLVMITDQVMRGEKDVQIAREMIDELLLRIL